MTLGTDQGTLNFCPFETTKITRVWNGLVGADEIGSFLPLECGEHELGVEVTATDGERPRGSQSFEVISCAEGEYGNEKKTVDFQQ